MKFQDCDMQGDKLNITEAAFASYYYIKACKCEEALGLIEAAHARLESTIKEGSEGDCTAAALWLWATGEYLKEYGNTAVCEKYTASLHKYIETISSEWLLPQRNRFGAGEPGVYLTNLSIIYSGLLSINSTLKLEKVQKLIIDIRKFVFDRFIKDGRLVSKLGSKEVYGDMTAAAMPFGMFGIEDRILIEALGIIETDLMSQGVRYSADDNYYGGCIRIDLTCLMAWYYSEKGEMGKAKALLEYAGTVWESRGRLCEVDTDSCIEQLFYKYWCEKNGEPAESYLCYILFELASLNITQKTGSSENDARINIIHMPSGYGDPYYYSDNERFPRYPEVGDTVFIKAITQPFSVSQEVWLEYSVNGKPPQRVRMEPETAKNSERYWQAELGRFDKGDSVEYFFVARQEDNEAVSCRYSFNVRNWQPFGPVMSAISTGNEICLNYYSINEKGNFPCLKLEKISERAVKWSLSLDNKPTVKPGNCVCEAAGTGCEAAGTGCEASVTGCEAAGTGCKAAGTGCQSDSRRAEELEADFYKLVLGLTDESTDIMLLDRIKNTCILKGFTDCGRQPLELLTDSTGSVYKVRLNLKADAAESFFGMGERYSHLEYRGLEVDNYVYNQYREQGLRTYIPVPFYISSEGYGVYLDTAQYSVFRFAKRLDDLVEIEVNTGMDNGLDFYMLTGEPKLILQELSGITGTAVLPPKWSFGLWMSSNNWDSQAETMKQLELTKRYEIPSTVLVLEQWSDEATFYIFNDAAYKVKDGNDSLTYDDYTFPEWGRWPDPKGMVEALHDNGLKVLLWQVSVEKYMNGVAHAQRDEDERVMLEKGYHVKHADGSEYRIPYNWFSGSLIPDFTNPQAAKWWLDKRLYLVRDIGIDGFKTDGGECVFGTELSFHDGSGGDVMRNRYPLEYIGSFHKFVQENVPGGGITFSRSGYAGAHKMPLHWAGDERSTWEAFRASVNAGLSCGMSGIPFWGWDMAGFHGDIPTAELYLRATEMAAFCPVMQYHAETKGEFNQDRTPWNIAERTGKEYVLSTFKWFADLRMNLLPYIYQQAVSSCRSGVPMMRSMFLEFPRDNSCRSQTQQYMFGESLLVAPVMEEGSYTKNVYLPEGSWMNFFTGESIEGRSLKCVTAAIDEIPVYLRENSVIPLNLADNLRLGSHVSNKVDEYKNLCFLLYLTRSCHYSFRDDMGSYAEIDAVREKDTVSINVKSSYSPVTLIIGGVRGAEVVEAMEDESRNIAATVCINTPAEYTLNDCELGTAIKISSKNEAYSIRLPVRLKHPSKETIGFSGEQE